MKQIGFIIIGLMLILFSGCNQEEQPTNNADVEAGDIEKYAEEFIQLLSEGNFEEATKHFDQTMKEELPPEQLEAVWKQVEEQGGTFVAFEYMTTQERDGYQVVLFDGLYEGLDAIFSVSFDKDNKIAGFFIQ